MYINCPDGSNTSNIICSYNSSFEYFSSLPHEIIKKIIRQCPKTSARVCTLFYRIAAEDLLSQWKSLENNAALSSKFRKKLTEIRGGDDDKKNGFDLIHEFFLSVKSTYKEALMPPVFPFDEKLGIFVKITQVDFTRLGENMLGDFQNYHLYKCWPKICLGLQKMGVKLPLMDGNAIRIWMELEANRQILAKIRLLDLSNLGLTSLPHEFIHFTGLIRLCLKGNKLTHLPKSICNLRSLELLDLSDNELSDLPESIDKLMLINKLNLSNNKLTRLPESICNLRSLEMLDLSKNKLTYLPLLFGNLRSLEKINLCDNELSALPVSICNFVSLRELDLSKNKLTYLPPLFGNLTSVEKINLCDNELSDIPVSIYVLASLKLFDLITKKKWATCFSPFFDNASLKLLSRFFGDLPIELQKMGINLPLMDGNAIRTQMWHEANRQMLAKITLLDLSNLGLTSLPPETIHFTGLIGLCLKGNKLTHLPESICNLRSLELLDLSDNELSDLPESICNLPSLKLLDLSTNKLTHLPPLFGNLTSVEEIDLCNNELLDIPESFCDLASLRMLDVSKNKLTHLAESICNLRSLKLLDLSDNELSDLPESIDKLVLIKKLNLSKNKLTHLPSSFGRLTALESLHVNDNKLTHLTDLIGKLVVLKVLNLSNNRLTYLPSSILDAGKKNGWQETLELSLDDNMLLLIPKSVLDKFASNAEVKNFKKLRRFRSDSSPLEKVCRMIRWGSEDSFNDPYGNFTERLECLIRKLGSSDQTYLYYLLDKKIYEKTGKKNEGDYISIARNRFKDMRLFASALGELLYSLKSIKNIN